jgi:23S rRNA (adenine1618-N6)-methyltransferase
MTINEKSGLHPKNAHKSGYDFNELVKTHTALKNFIVKNKFGNDSVDFSNPEAVKALNTALLKHSYNIAYWDIPAGYLCPPIPGRADYIHHVEDLLPKNIGKIHMLDIGVGANCIYPLIAHKVYNWICTGTDTDATALLNAQTIIDKNKLNDSIKLRHQTDPEKIFSNIILPDDYFHLTISNPPFHSSMEEATSGSEKKNRNLGLKRDNRNFGGTSKELWCEGGEVKFITQMIRESVDYKKNCLWFSTLVSKATTLPIVYEELKKVHPKEIRTLDMAQGQKKSRIIAWKFTP